MQQTGYQPTEEEKAGQGKRGGQHFMTLYLQEESAGANFNCHRISSLQPPIFSPYPLWPNGWMDQDATWHRGRPRPWPQCVRWGPSPPPKVTQQPPIFGLCVLWPNCWTDQDATWYGGRPRPRPHCVRCVSTVLNTDWQLESACQTLDLKRALAVCSRRTLRRTAKSAPNRLSV